MFIVYTIQRKLFSRNTYLNTSNMGFNGMSHSHILSAVAAGPITNYPTLQLGNVPNVAPISSI